MKNLLSLFLLLSCCQVQATWIIVMIENKSDLKLAQAVRAAYNQSPQNKQNVEIQSISKKIQNKTDLSKQDAFGSVGGCKIIAQNPQGQDILISFLADPTNRVANGRAKDADAFSRAAAGLHNQGMMARVMLEADGGKKLIGSYCGYEQESQPFKLVLKGSGGNYQAVLMPVASK